MQGARPFWFKGSFTPRISRYTRFIAQPRINHRRLCLLLFIPNLSSYPFPSRFCFLFLSYSFSSSFSSSSSLRARSSEILTRLLLLLPKMHHTLAVDRLEFPLLHCAYSSFSSLSISPSSSLSSAIRFFKPRIL